MSTTMVTFFQIVFFLLVNGIHGEGFSYENPEKWNLISPDCSGSRQSPIDLKTYDLALFKVPSPLQWKGYTRTPTKMTLENNGHSVELSATWNGDEVPYISGSVLSGKYAFAQLHFHWGSSDNVGSEHTINNHSLPLEMHMVHYKKEYGQISEAQKNNDGLAVVGILFEINKQGNRGISEIQKYASSIKLPGTKVDIKPFPLSAFDANFTGDYVSYLGSLTTPPCSQIVTWILAANPRLANCEQMDFFRKIKLDHNGDHNYRPTKPLNGRMVYYVEQ